MTPSRIAELEAALQVAVDEFRTVNHSNGGNLHASLRRAIKAYEAASPPPAAVKPFGWFFWDPEEQDGWWKGFITFAPHDCSKPDGQGHFWKQIALYERPHPSPDVANCCHCGRIIDMREEVFGGDRFGCELSDDRWVCSPECWTAVVEPEVAAAQSVSGVRKALSKLQTCWRCLRDEAEYGSGFAGLEADAFEDALATLEASLASEATPVAGEAKGDPVAWRPGETVRLDVSVGYASPAASFALATPPSPADVLKVAVEALRKSADAFKVIQTLDSHGASDQTYINWLRSCAREAELQAREILAAIRAKETT
jgi:hypothetical protein